MEEKKSCANCKNLSRPQPVTYSDELREERVICVKDLWERGSVNFMTIYEHAGMFRKRAERCGEYVDVVNGDLRIMRQD